jgi:hypothetical protein|tara:strand:+ start:44 stop:328 length:285 start_codon:yes stop_codon:yes gene_type:complete
MATLDFNGWSNEETWAVNLWITNNESTYNMVTKLYGYSKDDTDFAHSLEKVFWLLWEGVIPEIVVPTSIPMLGVNWKEISEVWGENHLLPEGVE